MNMMLIVLLSLRQDPVLLSQLKEQLFKLWGDLEENKSALLPKSQSRISRETPSSTASTEMSMSSPPQKARDMPDLEDSDAEDQAFLQSPLLKQPEPSSLEEHNPIQNKLDPQARPKNKAFPCCIKQYGVKVDEPDPAKANARNGQRWQRMFALFGTHISPV